MIHKFNFFILLIEQSNTCTIVNFKNRGKEGKIRIMIEKKIHLLPIKFRVFIF